jgi:hypothetical protein
MRRGKGSGVVEYVSLLRAFRASFVVAALLSVLAVPAAADSGGDPDSSLVHAEFVEIPEGGGLIAGADHLMARQEAKFADRLNSAVSRAERLDSADEFEDLNRHEAVDLLQENFGAQIDELTANPVEPVLEADEVIDFDAGSNTAVIDPEGPATRALIVSDVPMETDAGEVPDLSLEEAGGTIEPAEPLSEVEIPASPDGPISFEDVDTSVSMAGGSPTAPDADLISANDEGSDDLAFYPNAYEDTDVAVASVPGGVETFTHIRSADSPQQFGLDVDAPGGSSIAMESGGAVVRDSSGEGLLSVSRPFATDAQGRNVPTSMTVVGDRLRIDVAHQAGQFTYPILLDPLVEAWNWMTTNYQASWGTFQGWIPAVTGSTQYQFTTACTVGIANSCDSSAGGSGQGLHVNAPGGRTYAAGSQVSYNYTVPGQDSYIHSAQVASRRFYKGAASTVSNPYAFWGLKNGTDWRDLWFTNGSSTGALSFDGSNPTPALRAKTFSTGLTSDQTGVIPSGTTYFRYNRVAQVTFDLRDNSAPTLKPWTPSPPYNVSAWRNSAPFTVAAGATDSGLGVKSIGVLGSKPDGSWYGSSWSSDCVGTSQAPCPADTGTTPSFQIDPGQITEGSSTLSFYARDAAGTGSSTTAYGIKVDRSGPKITTSGSLTDPTGPGRTLVLQAEDTGLTSPTYDSSGNLTTLSPSGDKLRSGAKTVQVFVDGASVYLSSRTCTAANASCRIGPLTTDVNLGGLANGNHTIKVEAVDQVGNKSTKTWTKEVDNTAPTLVSADAPSAWQGGQSFNLAAAGGDDKDGIESVLVESNGTPVATRHLTCSSSCPNTFDDEVQVSTAGLPAGPQELEVSLVGPNHEQSQPQTVEVSVEKTAPVIGQIELPEWNSDSVTATVHASSTTSGVEELRFENSSGEVLGSAAPCEEPCTGSVSAQVPLDFSGLPVGTNQVTIIARSAAGRESSQQRTVKIDRTAPTLAAITGPMAALAGAYTGRTDSVSLTTGAADNQGSANSGMARIGVDDGAWAAWNQEITCTATNCVSTSVNVPFGSLLEGNQDLTVEAEDKAGNKTTREINFTIDRSGPLIDIIGGGTSKSDSWDTGESLDVVVDITDGPPQGPEVQSTTTKIDGVVVAPQPVPPGCQERCDLLRYSVPAAAGVHTVSVAATDYLGYSSQQVRQITLDQKAPTIAVSGDLEDGVTVGSGPQDVSVNAGDSTGSDPKSGVTDLSLQIDGTEFARESQECAAGSCSLAGAYTLSEEDLPLGAHEVKIVVSDLAGNETSETMEVERQCDVPEPVTVATPDPLSPAAAIGSVQSHHPDVVDRSEVTEVAGNELQPTLVESGAALLSEDTAQPSRSTADSAGAMVTGQGDQAVCLTPARVGEDAAPASIVNQDSALFANTDVDTDTVVRPVVEGSETFTMLRSSDAPENLTWNIDSQVDQDVSAKPDGSVSVTMDSSDLPVPDRPDDVPASEGQAETLVAEGELPAGTVDATPDAEAVGVEEIADAVAERPAQSQIEAVLPQSGPSGTGTPPASTQRGAAETIAAIADFREQAETVGDDLAEESADDLRDAEAESISVSEAWANGVEQEAATDIEGKPVETARITAPEALDADGDQVPVSLSATGDRVTAHVDHVNEGFDYPIAADPYVETTKTVVDYETYPVYRDEYYVSGTTVALRMLGWWDSKYCAWVSCTPTAGPGWYKVAGVFVVWLPNGPSQPGTGPLFEGYQKPVLSVRKVLDHYGQKPVLRQVTSLVWQDEVAEISASRLVDEDWDRGMNISGFQVHAFNHANDPGMHTIEAIKEQQGIDTTVINPRFYVKNRFDAYLKPHESKSPSDAGVRELADYAGGWQRKVVIKPHLDLRDDDWRGFFKPSNDKVFWPRYFNFILRYADIVKDENAEGLVIGTELSSLQGPEYDDKWIDLIKRVRKKIPSKTLYYATNWSEVRDQASINAAPSWWSRLDVIGIDYYPDNADLGGGSMLSPAGMMSKLPLLRNRFRSQRIVISETGAEINPNDSSLTFSQKKQRQASNYRAILNAALKRKESWFEGIWWYDRYTQGGQKRGVAYGNWTPEKPAVKVLCEYQTTHRRRC